MKKIMYSILLILPFTCFAVIEKKELVARILKLSSDTLREQEDEFSKNMQKTYKVLLSCESVTRSKDLAKQIEYTNPAAWGNFDDIVS